MESCRVRLPVWPRRSLSSGGAVVVVVLQCPEQITTPELPDQPAALGDWQAATAPDNKMLCSFEDIRIGVNGLHHFAHQRTDGTATFLEVGAAEYAPQAVTFRQHSDQAAGGVHHWGARQAICQQQVNCLEKMGFRGQGDCLPVHVVTDLYGSEHAASPLPCIDTGQGSATDGLRQIQPSCYHGPPPGPPSDSANHGKAPFFPHPFQGGPYLPHYLCGLYAPRPVR